MTETINLTAQERGELFMKGYQELEKMYGITLQFKLESEDFGTMIQVKLKHTLALIEGWTPPMPDEELDVNNIIPLK